MAIASLRALSLKEGKKKRGSEGSLRGGRKWGEGSLNVYLQSRLCLTCARGNEGNGHCEETETSEKKEEKKVYIRHSIKARTDDSHSTLSTGAEGD